LSVSWGRSVVSPVSSTNKTDCHNITEILLKVALNTITLTFMVVWPTISSSYLNLIYVLCYYKYKQWTKVFIWFQFSLYWYISYKTTIFQNIILKSNHLIFFYQQQINVFLPFFFHRYNWQSWCKWNIVETGVNHLSSWSKSNIDNSTNGMRKLLMFNATK